MINRSVDVNNLKDFDFFNDYKDTLQWLVLVERIAEARELERYSKEKKEKDND